MWYKSSELTHTRISPGLHLLGSIVTFNRVPDCSIRVYRSLENSWSFLTGLLGHPADWLVNV